MDALKPDAEISITDDLVRRLLVQQHPDLARHQVSLVDEGWDNVTFRVGSRWAVRLPRRAEAVQLLRNEQRWLPTLGAHLDLHTPTPDRVGRPGSLFPWPWSVVPWIEGTTADLEPLASGAGPHLAGVLRALHRMAPDDAPPNPYRGVPLRARSALMEDRLERLAGQAPTVARVLRRFWTEGLASPASEDRVWLHGDLHPRNVVVEDGRLVGLLDWGDLTAGDAATDLAAAWTLLRSEADRGTFWEAYGRTEASWRRARAWAAFFGAALSTSGEARHESMGRVIVEELVGPDAVIHGAAAIASARAPMENDPGKGAGG